ncbi:sensor histidine kinase [Promicromonospora sukumoe]|uniref:sensor histidine kinase n=1 Tax=Promicromonospora sukumoe TaxID=88382 RepID=UPI0037C9D0F9
MIFRRLGIRGRIAGGSFLVAVLICAGAGLVLNARIAQILRESTESILASDAAPYVAAISNDPGEQLDAPGPAQLVAVTRPDGTTALDTIPSALSAQVQDGLPADSTVELTADGTTYLVRTEPVSSAQGTWEVVTARSSDEETAALNQMRTLLITTLGVIAVGVLLTAFALTSASLRPVGNIRRTAERLIASPGSELLPVGTVDDEITRLARTLNELIGELRAAADRERQMVSDASHELRTPLAILRTQLELARTGPHSAERLLDDVVGAERSAARLSALVESLLELSSVSAAEPGRSTARELADEVRDAVDRAQFRARDRAVDITESISLADPDLVLALRAEDLGRIIDNLTGNALRAVTDPGRIEVVLSADGTAGTLTVTDTGGGMSPEFVDRALDRFSQGDGARAAGSGAGLGLAIVSAIVDRAGGRIILDNRPGTGLGIHITVPAATDGVG